MAIASTPAKGLAQRLAEQRRDRRTLMLDGATGTELERAGIRCELPLWSTHALLVAPDEVGRIHAAYRDAGASLITANTFRTQRRTLARAGLGARDRELTELALAVAREATRSDQRHDPVHVLGSAPPLEDCYRPDLVPAEAELAREHAQHAENLAAGGADGVLVETMGTIREARAATTAARATGLPTLVSFAATSDARGVARLLSSEPLAEAVGRVADIGAAAVLVNCLPSEFVDGCLPVLAATSLPFGAYPNQGAPLPIGGSTNAAPAFDRAETPERLAARAAGWLAAGATILGGCCGTTPAHVRAMARLAGGLR